MEGTTKARPTYVLGPEVWPILMDTCGADVNQPLAVALPSIFFKHSYDGTYIKSKCLAKHLWMIHFFGYILDTSWISPGYLLDTSEDLFMGQPCQKRYDAPPSPAPFAKGGWCVGPAPAGVGLCGLEWVPWAEGCHGAMSHVGFGKSSKKNI